jgi:acyl transferase domain-containing protein
MQPQQRLLLEVAEELLQKEPGEAIRRTQGLQAERTEEKVAVFVGSMIYTVRDYRDSSFDPTASAMSLTSHAPAILSNRVSYVFDLTGPSKTIDAACASSLVALHDAKHELQGDHCIGALAMGSSVICDFRSFLAVEGLHILSKVDRCKTFDTAADGIARGRLNRTCGDGSKPCTPGEHIITSRTTNNEKVTVTECEFIISSVEFHLIYIYNLSIYLSIYHYLSIYL